MFVHPDGKTQYSLRSTAGDFIRFLDGSAGFRIQPFESCCESDERNTRTAKYLQAQSSGKNLESTFEGRATSWRQAAIPSLGPGTTTEPSKTDMVLKSFGVSGIPVRSDAEKLAIDRVDLKLQGTPARVSPALVKRQLKFNAEDELPLGSSSAERLRERRS